MNGPVSCKSESIKLVATIAFAKVVNPLSLRRSGIRSNSCMGRPVHSDGDGAREPVGPAEGFATS